MREKKDRQEKAKRERIIEVYEKIPAIKGIDEEIFQAGLNISKSIIGNPDNYKKRYRKRKRNHRKIKNGKGIFTYRVEYSLRLYGSKI